MSATNRHPVDRLADVREAIRMLKDEEDALRQTIFAGACGLVGDQHEASVTESTTERLDAVALRKAWGDDKLRPYLKPSTVRTVKVRERVVPEEVG